MHGPHAHRNAVCRQERRGSVGSATAATPVSRHFGSLPGERGTGGGGFFFFRLLSFVAAIPFGGARHSATERLKLQRVRARQSDSPESRRHVYYYYNDRPMSDPTALKT